MRLIEQRVETKRELDHRNGRKGGCGGGSKCYAFVRVEVEFFVTNTQKCADGDCWRVVVVVAAATVRVRVRVVVV